MRFSEDWSALDSGLWRRSFVRHHRRECVKCHQRPARFWSDGRLKADRDHDLCPQCYRAAVDRLRMSPVQPPKPMHGKERE